MRRILMIFGILAGGLLLAASPAAARQSKEWQKALDARTVRLWVDAQFLEELVLNARARIEITWLPRPLMQRLDRDSDIEEWARGGLAIYYSSDPNTSAKMKGRDVLARRYRAEKNWNFDPTNLTVGDYRVTSDDLLGNASTRVIGELPSGTEGRLLLCVPSLKPGRAVRIALGPDSADLETPRR